VFRYSFDPTNKHVLLIGLVLSTLPLAAQVRKQGGKPAAPAVDNSLFHDATSS
jgi:hypothetical protein